MDAQLRNTASLMVGSYPTWDFQAIGGKVPIIYGDTEASQQATVTAFTQKGLIPQLASVGIDWVGLLTGATTLNEVDVAMNDSLVANGKGAFSPSYSFKNDSISVNIKKPQVPQGI